MRQHEAGWGSVRQLEAALGMRQLDAARGSPKKFVAASDMRHYEAMQREAV
jgi:hypothetical protein